MPGPNLSVGSKLIGRRNPGTVVKRRLQSINWPQNIPKPEIKRTGTPPTEIPVMRSHRFLVQLSDRALQGIALPVREFEEVVSASLSDQASQDIDVSGESGLAVVEVSASVSDHATQGMTVSGAVDPEVHVSDQGSQEIDVSGDAVPNVHASDQASQETDMSGNATPNVNVSESASQTIVESGDYVSAGEPEISIPVLDIDIVSINGGTIVEWDMETTPDALEIWRSVDGAAYALLSTTYGLGTGSYTDTDSLAEGQEFCYKARGLFGATYSDYSNIGCAVHYYDGVGASGNFSRPDWLVDYIYLGAFSATGLTGLSLPNLKVTGDLVLVSLSDVATLDFSSLVKTNGPIYVQFLDSLTVLDLPLVTEGAADNPFSEFRIEFNPLLGAVILNGANTFHGDFWLQGNDVLTSLTSTVITVTGNIHCPNNLALTTVSLPAAIFHNGQEIDFNACGLTAASVEHILALGVASGVTGAHFDFDSGTSAGYSSLSAQGQTDHAALISLGNTIDMSA